jgi:DnaJ-class molecular chaperone
VKRVLEIRGMLCCLYHCSGSIRDTKSLVFIPGDIWVDFPTKTIKWRNAYDRWEIWLGNCEEEPTRCPLAGCRTRPLWWNGENLGWRSKAAVETHKKHASEDNVGWAKVVAMSAADIVEQIQLGSSKKPRTISSRFRSASTISSVVVRQPSHSTTHANADQYPAISRFQTPESAKRKADNADTRLEISLEDLYSGATKRVKFLRGGVIEKKVIQIMPGWRPGTTLRFPATISPEDKQEFLPEAVLVVKHKPHTRFEREGDDLLCCLQLSLVESLTSIGGAKTIEMLDGRMVTVDVPSAVVTPGQRTLVQGEGMPIRRDGAIVGKGNLVVQWEILFPQSLKMDQQDLIRRGLQS